MCIFSASSVNIKGVVTRVEIIDLAGGLNDLLDPGIAEFNHIARFHIDQVIMLHAVVGLFKLRNIFSELVFDHQVAIQQQFDGVVQGGPTDPVIFILHEYIEGFNVKVTVPGIDLIKNSEPFGGLTVAPLFQILCKDVFYSILRLLLPHN